MGRLRLYVVGSTVMANVVLLRAYYERPNFYSAAVYLSQSTGSLLFLVNLMLIVAMSFGYGLQRLFYGPLRPIETEQLYDKAWFAVSETLLAMTIFRDEIGMWFFTMFFCLLAGKVWQWIGEGRVEFLEQQPPADPKLFHVRLASSLLLSVAFDIFMMQYCIDSILSDVRPGVMVMFGFEYVLLAIASASTLLRYTLSLVELFVTHRQVKAREEARRVAREQVQQTAGHGTSEAALALDDDDDELDVPGWEEKGRWVFYLDLATDFIKSVVYLGFFVILMTFYGIPIHIMRDLFMTIRSLIKRVTDFLRYRNATRDMNTRYPDATAEELERENTCIVCREEMRLWIQPGVGGAPASRNADERQRPKKLPCGHILHFSCLRSWLERQQVCPTCRRPVLSSPTPQNNNQANNVQPRQQQQEHGHGQLQPPGQARGGLQHGAEALPGQGQQAPLNGGQPNQPAGNLRVFNFGPIRIALGNLRVPAGQQNNNVAIRNAMDQLRQQALGDQGAQNTAQQQQNQSQASTQSPLPILAQGLPLALPAGGVALHPADIQSDILRLQHNIIESLRQLNAQHEQLEVVYRLLRELNHLQQVSGLTSIPGHEIPSITPLNSVHMDGFVPQAYLSRGPVMTWGDPSLPQGLTLPEGWTLRPMGLAPPRVQEESSSSLSSQTAPPSQPTTEQRLAVSMVEGSQAQAGSSTATPQSPPRTSDASPKAAESSSLESSWSFGNIPERSEMEGSRSALAGNSSQSQSVTRQTVTVEDAEENGQ